MCEADLDGEEEFYYTEIEVPLNISNNNNNIIHPLPSAAVTSHALITPSTHGVPYLLPRPTETNKTFIFEGSKVSIPNLADHMDMAR